MALVNLLRDVSGKSPEVLRHITSHQMIESQMAPDPSTRKMNKKDMESKNNALSSAWPLTHWLVDELSDNPDQPLPIEKKQALVHYLYSLAVLLPDKCPCSQSIMDELRNHFKCETKREAQVSLWAMHNRVNKKLGYPVLPFEEAMAKQRELRKHSLASFVFNSH